MTEIEINIDIEGMGGESIKMIYAPGRQKPSRRHFMAGEYKQVWLAFGGSEVVVKHASYLSTFTLR